MNKQGLLDEFNKVMEQKMTENDFSNGIKCGLEVGIRLVEQLNEPAKVAIPKFVADYIEFCKGWNGDRQAYTEDDSGLWFALCDDSCCMSNSVSDWLFNEEKVETFARAWLDGYEIEKEKLYYVEIIKGESYLCQEPGGRIWVSNIGLDIEADYKGKMRFTEVEIKAIGEKYWAFAAEVK